MDFMGNNFEYLPFGAGRRMCPAMSFGLINVYLPLANLLYHFDWKLPHGVKLEDVDMNEFSGIAAARKSELYLIALLNILLMNDIYYRSRGVLCNS